jgi:hypothetical protein
MKCDGTVGGNPAGSVVMQQKFLGVSHQSQWKADSTALATFGFYDYTLVVVGKALSDFSSNLATILAAIITAILAAILTAIIAAIFFLSL